MSEEGMTFSLQASGATPSAEPEVIETPLEQDTNPAGDQGQTARSFADQTQEADPGGEVLLAGKYKTQEELEKGYLELQKVHSQGRPKTHDQTLEGVLDQAGLNPQEVVTNYNADGKLADSQYEALANLGFSRHLVDDHLAGLKAKADNGNYAVQQMRATAENMAGGKERLDGLLQWASQGSDYDQAKVDDLNSRIQDPTKYEGAIKEMLYDWQQETGRGSSTQLIQGDRMPETSAGFTSSYEMTAALAKCKEAGRMDESTKRRLKNTAPHILQGVDS